MRSGGKTGITFLFDCGFTFALPVPVAYVLANFTDMPILPFYAIVQALDVVKCIAGMILIKNGFWLNNMVEEKEDAAVAEE